MYINVGLIGYKFMGKAHSHAYLDMPKFFKPKGIPVMKAICGRDEARVRETANIFGWQGIETSWKRLVERKDIDLIDITAPTNVHKEIAIAAAEAGKHILCEKPLAMNLKEAREMLKAVESAGIKHMVGFNYRRAPAIALAKRLIQDGLIGKIYHFRAVYLQDWIVDPNFPLVWRLQKDIAGSGSLGDLGAHLIDIARFLVGEFEEVIGMSETFIKERPLAVSMTGLSAKAGEVKERGEVTVDDATLFLVRFTNGALGSFEATRFAPGRKNYNSFEINGSEGSIIFNLERMNELQFCSRKDPEYASGFRTILVTESIHPYISAWWPPGHIIGYEHTFIHEIYDLCEAIANDTPIEPNFYDGVKCQEVLEAVELSIRERRWVKISEL
ncbi:MAG: Gfo/Idh/MocA family oxidoreductase [bacterium]|nr:Gfo/Idh/MocA family oxidoreductase [bacterium]